MIQRRFYPIFFLLLLVFAVSCDELDNGGGNVVVDGAPTIVNFSASPPTVSPNSVSTLSWRVDGDPTTLRIDASVGASPGVVTGTSVDVQPTQTTTYTLTAENSAGSDSAGLNVTVSGDPTNPNPPAPPPGNDTTAPSGTFGVSSTQSGPFQNDKPDGIDSAADSRVVEIAPGGTFYAQVSYNDPSGVSSIQVNLVNSNPDGIAGPLDPEQQFFTLGTPVSGCDLPSNPVSVTCVYPVTVADDAVNISQLTNSEFAYVFRTKVTDAAGNQSDEAIRGYVEITGNNPTPPTNPPPGNPDPPSPPSPPSPPENQSPSADAGDDQTVDVGEEVTLAGSGSSDPDDGDTLSYVWEFTAQPDDSDVTLNGANTATPTFTPSEDGDYTVQLTVSDGNGGSDTDSVTITAEAEDQPPTNPPPGNPNPPSPPSPPENQAPSVDAGDNQEITLPDDSVELDGTASDDGLPNGSSLSVTWSKQSGPGDVAFGNASNVDTSATFSEAGIYVLTLAATDGAKPSSDNVTVTVKPEPTDPPTDPNPPANQPPVANFTAAQQDGTLSVRFDASNSNDPGPNGGIASYSWSFGDGSSTTTQGTVFTKTYSQAGSYAVTLTVVDNDEATGTETKDITVEPVAPSVEAPVISSFIADPETIAPGGSSILSWTLAGGPVQTLTFTDTSNNQSADVTDDEDQSFTIEGISNTRTFELTATNAGGTDTAEVTLVVSDAVIVTPPGDDILIANDDTVEEEGPAIEVEVLINDTVPAVSDGYSPVEITLTEPMHGTVSENDGAILYEVSGSYTGPDSFEYTLAVTDNATGEILSDSATVTVTVEDD